MGERLAFTFALTGRREWEHGTQGASLGYELAGLSARAEPQIGHPQNNPPPTSYLNFASFGTPLDFLKSEKE